MCRRESDEPLERLLLENPIWITELTRAGHEGLLSPDFQVREILLSRREEYVRQAIDYLQLTVSQIVDGGLVDRIATASGRSM